MSHTIVHFEIPADDPEKLAGFYTSLFDWKIQKMSGMPGMEDVEYWTVGTTESDERGQPKGPGVNGGMMPRQMPGQMPVNYVGVDSVPASVAKAKSLGANVMVDTTPIPGMGWFAQLTDPQGNPFALFQTDPAAK